MGEFPPPSRKTVSAIRRKLLRWFAQVRRDVPWRVNRDPYRVWVSEIMLQQTRIEAVRPYFERFVARFPDVHALAAADIDDVLKCWEGLGYYSRARHLHAAAGKIVSDFGGELPPTVEELRKLPGIGPYTAGAIASIAFGADEPVLDGNVARVLCRLFRIPDDPRDTAVRKQLWSLARALLPHGRAGDFNEAIMELGQEVCIPRRPRCPTCPLAGDCAARAAGEQEELPLRRPGKAVPHHTIAVGVVWRGRGPHRKLLIDRRKPEGLLGGLWEFPGGKVEPGEDPADAVAREIREEVGIEVRVGEPLASVEHAYSHFRITLLAFQCHYVRGRARPIECDAAKWISLDELDDYAFPQANRKVFAALRRAGNA